MAVGSSGGVFVYTSGVEAEIVVLHFNLKIMCVCAFMCACRKVMEHLFFLYMSTNTYKVILHMIHDSHMVSACHPFFPSPFPSFRFSLFFTMAFLSLYLSVIMLRTPLK